MSDQKHELQHVSSTYYYVKGDIKLTCTVFNDGTIEVLPTKGDRFRFQHSQLELFSAIADAMSLIAAQAKNMKFRTVKLGAITPASAEVLCSATVIEGGQQ